MGCSEFGLDVLSDAQEALDEKYAVSAKGVGITDLVAVASRLMSVASEDPMGPSSTGTDVKARVLICYLGVKHLGLSINEMGNMLNFSISTVSVAVTKKPQIIKRHLFKLADLLNVEY